VHGLLVDGVEQLSDPWGWEGALARREATLAGHNLETTRSIRLSPVGRRGVNCHPAGNLLD
jgi:hypothetical protein